MADNSFTFWSNMKEVIDIYDDPVYKYKLYDALTEYGLYGIWPEDDGTPETKNILVFIQSLVPSLDKSRNFQQKVAESGAAGGRKQKVTDEQVENAVRAAALKKKEVPTRQEVVDMLFQQTNIKIDKKTISRRCGDDRKKELAEEVLRDIINVSEDKNNVSNEGDKIEGTSYVPGTLGQNGDITCVSGDKNDVPNTFNF